MNHLETRQIVRVLSQEYGLSIQQVEDIIGTIPEFIKATTREEVNKLEGYYPVFRVPGMGTFHVPEGVAKHVKIKLNKRLRDESTTI